MNESEEVIAYQKINLELGDIIQIDSPSEPTTHNQTYYIKYIDPKQKIKLVDKNRNTITLLLDSETGSLNNESILGIDIISRSPSLGYARQHNLLPGKWVNLYFSGDIPYIATGKITNLEEDMIELTTYPEREIIYINFDYKGLPEDISLDRIILREAPLEAPMEEPAVKELQSSIEPEIDLEARLKEVQRELLAMGYSEEEYIEESQIGDGTIQEHIKDLIFTADQISFGDELGEITQRIDVPESEQRFGIGKQTQDLLDDILSRIPNIQRTDSALNEIYKIIDRFKELRETYSLFDDRGNANIPLKHEGDKYKPLVAVMESLSQKLYWLLPVVQLKKKLYDIEEEMQESTDVTYLMNDEVLIAEDNVVKTYKEGNVPDNDNKYLYLVKELTKIMTPFDEPDNTENLLMKAPVNTNLYAVVSNLDNFYSSTNVVTKVSGKREEGESAWQTDIYEKRFLTQVFNIGLTGLEITKSRGQPDLTALKKITENDEMSLKSIMTLPMTTILFSRINMPSTGIIDKINLNKKYLNYWRFFNKKTSVSSQTIEDFSDNTSVKPLSDTNIQEFSLGASEAGASASEAGAGAAPSANKYRKLLEKVLPQTTEAFDAMKPYLSEEASMSFAGIIAQLEPFMVYQKDINYMQAQDMNKYLLEKIDQFKKKYAQDSKLYYTRKNKNLSVYDLPQLVNALFILNENYREEILEYYGFVQKDLEIMTVAEFMSKINKVDNGILFSQMMALLNANLLLTKTRKEEVEDKLQDYINEEQGKGRGRGRGEGSGEDDEQNYDEPPSYEQQTIYEKEHAIAEQQKKCNTIKNIAKRYIEIDELEEDNNQVDVYFDKNYDSTNYSLIEEFKNKLNSVDDRVKTLAGLLVKTYKMKMVDAEREANAILLGKRKVQEGDYAVLEMDDPANNDQRLLYYERKANVWVLNKDIPSEAFLDYNSKSPCNIIEKCLFDKTKQTCNEEEKTGKGIKDKNLQKVVEEYSGIQPKNNTEITDELWEKWTTQMSRIQKIINMQKGKEHSYDKQKSNIGYQAQEVQAVKSPYADTRDLILSQEDFGRRQVDILKFVTNYTREPTKDTNDSPYWFYCIDTHTKLLPTFLYKLAKAFLGSSDKSTYLTEVKKLCAEQGTLSDDGDCYVDKFSGYIIRKLDFDVSAEYTEEGFKDVYRAVMEADLGDSLVQEIKKQEEFNNPDAIKIRNVIKTMSTYMSIKMDAKYEFIIRNVMKQIGSIMPSKQKFAAAAAMKAKTATSGKAQTATPTYEETYDSYLVLLSLSYYLIAIQISMPNIKSKKTHPGCIKSFNGYPMEGAEDKTGLTYVACVASKMEKRSVEPWQAIAKLKDTEIRKGMEALINAYILKNEEVQDGFKNKLAYLLLNKEEDIPAGQSLSKWVTFLPPLQPFKLSLTENVSKLFIEELLKVTKNGNKKQDEMMHIVRSKIIRFALAIQELVSKTVHKKAAILTNSLMEPFLENACCHEADYNTLAYFIKEQPEIDTYNKNVIKLSEMYDHLILMGKAAILYDASNTKRPPIKIPEEFSEETIYRAFIVFCKYNNEMGLSNELKAICGTKPQDFDENDAIEESILKLKRDGKLYNKESLNQLLNVVNRVNTVNQPKPANSLQSPLNKLDILLRESTTILPKEFITMFREVIKQQQSQQDPSLLRDFKNYLAKTNKQMSDDIIDFIKKSGVKVSKKDMNNFIQNFEKLTNFKLTGDNRLVKAETETFNKMSKFVKNAVRNITRVFPNMIINKISYSSVKIPVHWKLADLHMSQLKTNLDMHYARFYEYYEDVTIADLMQKLIGSYKIIDELIENTLFTDDRLMTLLYQFYLYCVFFGMIHIDLLDSTSEITPEEVSDNENSETDWSKSDKRNALEMVLGEKKNTQDKLVGLLLAFVNVLNADKNTLDYNYTSLMERINRSKEREKDMMTTSLKKLSPEELQAQDLMKNHRIDKWNVGMQKGLFKYQTGTYEEETLKRLAMDADMSEVKMGAGASGAGASGAGASKTEAGESGEEEMSGTRAEGELDYEETMIGYEGEDPEPDMELEEDEYYLMGDIE